MRHSRFIAAAAIAAVAALALAFVRDADEKSAPSNPVEVSRQEVAYPPAILGAAAVIRSPNAATRPPGEREVDLCGLGPVPSDALPGSLETESDLLLLAAAAKLEQSNDDRVRALALLTRASIEAEAAQRNVYARDPVTCFGSAACDEEANAAFARAATPSIGALTRLAAATRQPETYVAAMRACRSIAAESAPAGCNELKYEQWARLDPDNAMPWLFVARAARQRNDAPAFDEALLRASHAKFFSRRPTLYGTVLAATEAREDPVRTLVLAKIADAQRREDPADYVSNFTMFRTYCTKATDAAQRQVCADLLDVLARPESDRLAIEVNIVMDEHAPDLTRAMSRAYSRLDPDGQSQPAPRLPRLSCDWSARTQAWLEGLARQGERAYILERLAEANKR